MARPQTVPFLLALFCAATAQASMKVATSGGLTREWDQRGYSTEALWAYQPVQRPATPGDVVARDGVLNSIDAFVQQRLKYKNVSGVAPPADKRTLIRRLTLDLTGLS